MNSIPTSSATKPSIKALFLRNAYLSRKRPNLQRTLSQPAFKKWWDEMSNADRTYVLKGKRG